MVCLRLARFGIIRMCQHNTVMGLEDRSSSMTLKTHIAIFTMLMTVSGRKNAPGYTADVITCRVDGHHIGRLVCEMI